jgi:hypothetical protein
LTKRTVWLIKILALIVGGGNVAGILADVGIPWFLAIVPEVHGADSGCRGIAFTAVCRARTSLQFKLLPLKNLLYRHF